MFVTATLSVTLVSSIVLERWTLQRSPRQTGHHVPSGKCETFKWGGESGVHWYICCNNCEEVDTSCDGTTYESASREKYCDNCGVVNQKGNGEPDGIYECGGCYGQIKIKKKCETRLRKIYELPGLCWAFAKCFQKQCGELSTMDDNNSALRFGVTKENCFDLVCDDGETVETCPVDCCGTINDVCDWRKYNGTNDFPPVCCSESTCCDATNGVERMLKETAIEVMTWR